MLPCSLVVLLLLPCYFLLSSHHKPVFQVLIIGPPDTLYEGGFFKCHLLFPREYPLKPPVLKLVN